jgi:hypothetical protein
VPLHGHGQNWWMRFVNETELLVHVPEGRMTVKQIKKAKDANALWPLYRDLFAYVEHVEDATEIHEIYEEINALADRLHDLHGKKVAERITEED